MMDYEILARQVRDRTREATLMDLAQRLQTAANPALLDLAKALMGDSHAKRS